MSRFSVAKVFSSSMVLQREKNIRVFGKGENGAAVKVSLNENEVTAYVEAGKWMAILPPMKAQEDCTMTIQCGENRVVFDDIAIGEVWLAGGQSNMEFEVQNCAESKEILEEDKDINVRFYYTEKNQFKDEHFYEVENQSRWYRFGTDDTKRWSAVGYIFARKIAKELGVTVGIIGCNWGGTSAACWQSRESLAAQKDINIYNEEYDRATEGKSIEEQIKEFDEYAEYQAAFDVRSQKAFAEHPGIGWAEIEELCGKNMWPGPMNCKSPYRPGGLYECMVQRVMPYTLRGFIYYQGEMDETKSEIYDKLQMSLIQCWRKGWKDDTLPFLITQLPMHRYKDDPDWKNWCMIRENQMKTYQTVKNTGIAVILDCGEFNEIHPKKKSPVGERLALQALCLVYGKASEKDAFGPIYKDCVRKKDCMELHFQYAEDGFEIRAGEQMFEIAGRDQNYVPAKAEVDGSMIRVSAEGIDYPMYARYCWSNYCDVTVFGKNGIPLAPFRTDEEDGFAVHMD
ncbi:MAG: sialate O-acetylesterase [Clostridium sp.]|nr:sialate O-acetylesterase [Clostridium sp.]